MTEQHTTPQPAQDNQYIGSYFAVGQPPTPKPKPRRKWVLPVVALATLVLGLGTGFAAQPAPKTVTVTETVTKEIEVAVTPKECRTALDLGQSALSSAGETISILSGALGGNLATLQGVPAKIQAQTQIIKDLTPKYTSARSACLASE